MMAAFPYLACAAGSELAPDPGKLEATLDFNIPAGEATVALRQFSEQAGLELLYSTDAIAGVITKPVLGRFPPQEALAQILRETPLRTQRHPITGGYAITRNRSADDDSHVPSTKHGRAAQPSSEPARTTMKKTPLAVLRALFGLVFAAPIAGAAESNAFAGTLSATASLSGTVRNAATGNHLEGARIEVPALGRTTFTDGTGSFTLYHLPAGTHTAVVSYLGLDPVRMDLTLAAGSHAVRNVDLTTAIYRLAEFKVTGEREGNAAAITLQRNASNVKNVVAMDSFGNLPNMSAGELAIRLPGAAGELDGEGNVTGVVVRGMAYPLNTVTVDGSLISSPGGFTRRLPTQNFTAAMIDSLELIKAHTPDTGADSLGGTINLKSRSMLGMAEKRRVTYNFSARVAPSFTQHIPIRRDHPSHPLINFAYQELFNVFGQERNLGVAVNLFYSENANGYFQTTRDFENTPNQPAFLWDYRTQDVFNNRHNTSASVKFEYRLSPRSKFSLNTIANNTNEPHTHFYATRAFTNQVVGATGTAGILPGYTNRITQVRAVAASTIDVTDTMLGTMNRNRHVQFGGEHEFGRLLLDYTALYSITHVNRTSSGGGTLVNRVTGAGWILDRTQSDLYPRFTQAGGPAFTDFANYRPTESLTDRNWYAHSRLREVRGNLRYELPTRLPVAIKAGAQWREQLVEELGGSRRWTYRGTTALAPDPGIVTFDSVKTGSRIPQWGADDVIGDQKLLRPELWTENLYFRQQSQYTQTHAVTETVTAGYAMGQGRIRRTGWLAGVRTEKTDTSSYGWVRARVPSTAAQQLADPVGAAQRDYANNRRVLDGSYTKSFPSAHLTQELSSNLKARLSWSTSFGRPHMANLVPSETVNEQNQTLTLNNPSLLPQLARNWDATLDYYFEPVGNVSVGWFHKRITDYIVTGIVGPTIATGRDNGYEGEYVGFTPLSSANAGTAIVQGWELSYQQQFTFLPGLLKGLSGLLNYTALTTHGDFGGRSNLSSGQVAGFIPRTGNASLAWRYRGFGARVLVNYTGDYITTYTATSAARNLFRFKRTAVNLGFSYQLWPAVTLTGDIANLFNEPQAFYRGIKDQMQSTIISGTTITVGVSGRF